MPSIPGSISATTADAMTKCQHSAIDSEEAELTVRLHLAQHQLDAKRSEKLSLIQLEMNRAGTPALEPPWPSATYAAAKP